jgi:hypothetical protein
MLISIKLLKKYKWKNARIFEYSQLDGLLKPDISDNEKYTIYSIFFVIYILFIIIIQGFLLFIDSSSDELLKVNSLKVCCLGIFYQSSCEYHHLIHYNQLKKILYISDEIYS